MNFKYPIIFPYLALALCLVLASCAGRVSQNENTHTDAVTPESTLTPLRTVIDGFGREITVPTTIHRVISLAPSLTESIFAVGAGDRLVGVTTFCNYPEEAKSIAKVGDTLNPNMETIVALKPDIVFVSSASQLESFMNTLEKNGITVYVSDPVTFHNIYEEISKFGVIFGTEERANALAAELEKREASIQERLGTVTAFDGPPLNLSKVFVQISKEPLFTIGERALLNRVLIDAGGISVTRNVPTAFPKLSKETALALQPEAIVLSDSPDNQEPNEVFKNSPAVKNGRVYKINADIISRPGPRLIDALEQIARDLHPEKFPK